MDFTIPAEIKTYLSELDAFIEKEIKPLERENDNIRFFDHRREWARTDFERGGLPRHEWEALLGEMRRRADRAGHYRFALPKEYGGKDGSNLAMAIIREHLAAKGLGLHNDLQTKARSWEFSTVLMFRDFGTEEQRDKFIPGILDGSISIAFGLTEPAHGSDATWMETRGVREGDSWKINGAKIGTRAFKLRRMISCSRARADVTGAPRELPASWFRPRRQASRSKIPLDIQHADGPSARLTHGRSVPADAILGDPEDGLAVAQHFVHENRIRQAASSLGAAQYCIDESVKYAKERKPFGRALASNQAIQWPLVELHTEAAMLRSLIHKTAWKMDQMSKPEVALKLSDKVSMCNYRANRLVCEAADRAMQTHGGIGYSRHKPFEHIYRHHRRYRITEGAEDIQMRRVAQILFGFGQERNRASSVSEPIAPMRTDDFTSRIQSLVERRIGSPGTLHELRRLTGGANRATWSFDADVGAKRESFILQQSTESEDPVAGVTPEVDSDQQARLMIAAVVAGAPAPHVRAILEAEDGLGRGYITERVAGETLGPRILRDERYAGARKLMASQCGEILAASQVSNPQSAVLNAPKCRRAREAHRKIVDHFGFHLPALELALRWAIENIRNTNDIRWFMATFDWEI